MNQKYHYILKLIVIILICSSCSKKEQTFDNQQVDIPEGYALLKIEYPEITIEEENLSSDKNASVTYAPSNNTLATQTATVQNNGFECQVSLTPESKTTANLRTDKLAEKITKTVDNGVKYRLYAFDKSSGLLVDSATYTRGQEANAKDLKLIGNKDYIFVAYSNNDKNNFPSYLSNKNNINTAEILNADVDFMFFKGEMFIPARSQNTLKIKFRHTFSQITTIIKLDSRTAKYTSIKGVSNASFIKPAYTKTKFKVSDGSIQGLEKKSLGAEVKFPTISNSTTTEIKAQTPTIINSPANGEIGELIIESLTIGNITRGNLVVKNLKLTPGVKYNLELTFYVPPTQEVLDPSNNPYFKYYQKGGNGDKHVEYTVNLTNPTFGAQLDIFYLDNSFQLYVNDSPVFSKEINFEDYLKSDVEFSDGTWYGKEGSGIGQIYWINDTERKEVPIVRLVIDEDGKILLYGRKSLKDELRLLKLRNGATFKSVKFDPKGTNKLRFYSTIWNITDVWGRIYGIQAK